MKQFQFLAIIIASLAFAQAATCCDDSQDCDDYIEQYDKNDSKKTLVCSAATFHASRLFNRIWFGKSFNFSRITDNLKQDDMLTNGVYIRRNETGQILCVCDGKTPIVLGSIPSSKEDIEELKKTFKLPKHGQINVYTLIQPFERRWSGLDKLIKKNPRTLQMFYYETTDFGPPSFLAIIRCVNDLENRDKKKHELAYVHCKSGRGRSAVMVGAYIAHLCKKSGSIVTVEEIYNFLKMKGDSVSNKDVNKQALKQFCRELDEAGSFEALCVKYAEALVGSTN